MARTRGEVQRRKRARAEKNARSNTTMDGEADAPRNVHHEQLATPFYCFRCQETMQERHWYEWKTSIGELLVCVDCHGYLGCLAANARDCAKRAKIEGKPVLNIGYQEGSAGSSKQE
eukprot:TRINITY_DN82745_c0_g1_i1.p3 TRINITY_DN82745_c0_g1~~TRINITY_DN82745_c0_g1_i1.p3  ORF type:complete len:117 (+),score=13.83 TRINITY_DN82745_c0_g1_i1:66-416(+)